MKDWFPFTDYDFYGYLVSGFCFLFALDYAFADGSIILQNEWTFVETVLAVGIAYFCGQLMAAPSSVLLEHFVARTLLPPPMKVLLSDDRPGALVRFMGACVLGRNYTPISVAQRKIVLSRAAKDNETNVETVSGNFEMVFSCAYHNARQNDDTRNRLDSFRNQYGLNRNMSFTALTVSVIFAWQLWVGGNAEASLWLTLALFLFAGTFIRFLKFYAAFAAEVVRSYSYSG